MATWAAATTDAWTKEVQTEWKRQRRCEGYARLRAQKKSELGQMRQERDRLQRQVKQQLTAMSSDKTEANAMYQVALESDKLRNENVALRERLQQHKRFLSLSQEAVGEFDKDDPQSVALSVSELSRKSPWTSKRGQHERGYWVEFPNDEPPFFFLPFTNEAHTSMINCCDQLLGDNPPVIEPMAELFGWTIHYAPLTRRPEDDSMVAHIRFTSRLACSLNDLDEKLVNSDTSTWPLLATPLNYSREQLDGVSTQVLQEFEGDGFAMVRNIPGSVHFRYIQLAKRLPRKRLDGKREIAFIMVIADNDQQRDPYQEGVQWFTEGGNYLKVTEVDDTTIDVSYDNWATCVDELHAQHLFWRWTQYTIQLLQFVRPTLLLT